LRRGSDRLRAARRAARDQIPPEGTTSRSPATYSAQVRESTRELVDRWWAEMFSLSVAELLAPGTKAVTHTGLGGYPGVYLLVLGPSVVVSSPARIAAPLTEVLGPSVHLYADRSPDATDGVREVPYDDLSGLRSAAGATAWENSGFAGRPELSFAVERDGQVVAASNLALWRGTPADIGVLVDPAYAGRGLGRQVAAHAARRAIELSGVARYRAPAIDTASRRIASALGFEAYGMNVALKPAERGARRPPPTSDE
jgi:GNAT superfamily N-acetyltransferase